MGCFGFVYMWKQLMKIRHESYRKYMKEVKILFFNIDSILNKSKKKVIKKE